jgi:hypothetical protein
LFNGKPQALPRWLSLSEGRGSLQQSALVRGANHDSSGANHDSSGANHDNRSATIRSRPKCRRRWFPCGDRRCGR